jgi:hypothetical protein
MKMDINQILKAEEVEALFNQMIAQGERNLLNARTQLRKTDASAAIFSNADDASDLVTIQTEEVNGYDNQLKRQAAIEVLNARSVVKQQESALEGIKKYKDEILKSFK